MRGATLPRARRLACAAIVLAVLAPTAAHADGGLVRARAEQGTLVATLFTSPTPLRVGDADVSVLVQDRTSHATLLDAEIFVRLEPAGGGEDTSDAGPDRAETVRLGHEAATNKLLQAGSLRLRAAGRYLLVVEVRRGSERLTATTEVEVAPPRPPLLALWPLLALPPVVVGIFLVHQWLRRRSLGTARRILVADAGGGAP